MQEKKTGPEITQEDVNKALYLAAMQTVRINSMYQWEMTDEHLASAAVTTRDIVVTQHDDRIYVVTHMAAVDETTNVTSIALYSNKSGQNHLMNSDAPSAANISINWDGELITSTGQKLRAVFTTPSASDKLRFTVSGYWVPK